MSLGLRTGSPRTVQTPVGKQTQPLCAHVQAEQGITAQAPRACRQAPSSLGNGVAEGSRGAKNPGMRKRAGAGGSTGLQPRGAAGLDLGKSRVTRPAPPAFLPAAGLEGLTLTLGSLSNLAWRHHNRLISFSSVEKESRGLEGGGWWMRVTEET